MEIRDAAQRIFRVHRWLLCITVAVGLLAGAAVHVKLESRTYTASARLNLGGSTPQSTAEAAALAGTVQGVVTSPDRIASALAAAHIKRDPVIFANKDVNTQPVSASGILELQVTDTSPGAAASVANFLASGAVSTLNAERQTGLDTVETQLRTESTQLSATIAGANAQLAAGGLSTDRQAALVAERSDASQRLSTIVTKQVDVALQAAQQPSATVVDAAVPPDRPDPSRLVLDIILGLVAGLVAGLGGAAILETLRPTAVGRRGVEAALGAPVVGTLRARAGAAARPTEAAVARICHVARRAEVSTVLLWSPRADLDLASLADAMQSALRGHHRAGVRPGSFEFAALDPDAAPERRQAVLAVLPSVTRVSKLDAVKELCRDDEWPLLGAVLMEARSSLLRRRTRRQSADLSSAAAAVPGGGDGKHLRVVNSPRKSRTTTAAQSEKSAVGR